MARKTRSASLEETIERAKRGAILEHALQHPDLTLGELVALDGGLGEVAASLTVRELRGGGGGDAEAGGTPKEKAAAPRGAGRTVNTRTPEGRDALDAAVLQELRRRGGKVSAVQLRKACGGSADQIRRSLNRLIEAGKVTYTGQARGTRYEAV